MKRNFNQITKMNLYRLKIFALAGLLGLAACKDRNEPAAPATKSNDNGNNTNPPQEQVDNFMSHMSDVNDARFFKPRDYNGWFEFGVDRDDRVAYFIEGQASRSWEALYKSRYMRSNVQSPDNVGYFSIPAKTYQFSVETNGEVWNLIGVPDNVYNTMTTERLANIVINKGSGTAVREAVLAGQGSWSEENPGLEGVQATFESNGGKVGLKHSDFGVFDTQFRVHDSILQKIGTDIEGLDGNIYHFARVYGGGVYSKEAAKLANSKYNGTAVAQLEETDGVNKRIIYTNPGAASMVVDAQQNETIQMPFNNWYHVTIIKTSNHITMNLNEANTSIPNKWRVANPSTTDFDAVSGRQENALYVVHSNNFETPFKGSTGVEFGENDPENKNIGVRTVVAADYFGDTQSEPSEVIVQGYRTDRNFINATEINGIFFGFVFGGVKQQQK